MCIRDRDYKISRGDTMASISRKTGVPVAELRRINQVSEPLRAGRVLKIPGTNRTGVDPRALASVRGVPSAKGTSVASAGRQVTPSRTVSASAPVREKVVSTASAASHEVKPVSYTHLSRASMTGRSTSITCSRKLFPARNDCRGEWKKTFRHASSSRE